MMTRGFFITAMLICLLATIKANGAVPPGKKLKVLKFSIKEEISPAATRKTLQAFALARAENADLILLHLDTYGGYVSDADSIRTCILNSDIPVYVFIENNAASAGALISIACNKIFMRKGANIGAATVVNQSGEAAPDKYQSYMRSKMRATAEARGRNPEIAEAMVDGNIVVDSVNKKGQVVTFTTSEALRFGFCDGQAENEKELFELIGVRNYAVIEYTASTVDRAIGFLLHPGLSSVLILLILGGLFYEMKAPGLGLPIVVSIVASLLYFAPHYLEGLATHWEILLFVGGLVLLGLEIFVLPGFGIAGIGGILLVLTGLVLSMIRNVNFNFDLAGKAAINTALLSVIFAFAGFVVLVIIAGNSFLRSPFFQRLVLSAELQGKATDADAAENNAHLLAGVEAEAFTDLRPFGKIALGNKLLEATTRGEFLEKGTRVVIIEERNNALLVERSAG